MAWLPVALSLPALIVLYWPTVAHLAGLWTDLSVNAYGHGFLVVLISAYMIWTERRRLAELSPAPDLRGLLPLAGLSAIWLAGALTDVRTVQVDVMVLLILAIIWTTLGAAVTRRLLLPVLYLYFAIPVWEPLLPALQAFTSVSVTGMLKVLGLPVYLDGHVINLPGGSFSVNEACSGLRYLLAALTLGVLYAYLNYSRLWPRIAVIAIAACAAILANLLRVFIVVLLGHLTEMQHPWVKDHLNLGWMLFGVLVFILLAIDLWLHRRRQAGHEDAADRTPPEGRLLPTDPSRYGVSRAIGVAFATVFVLSTGPVLAQLVAHQASLAQPASALGLPSASEGWQGPQTPEDNWSPQYRGAVSARAVYRSGAGRVYLYIGYYPVQRQGEELINELNRIADGKTWQPVGGKQITALEDDRRVLEQVIASGQAGKRLVWYWYEVAGRVTTSPYVAKLLQLQGIATGNRAAGVIAIAAPLGGDRESSRAVLRDFLRAMPLSLHSVVIADAQGGAQLPLPPDH